MKKITSLRTVLMLLLLFMGMSTWAGTKTGTIIFGKNDKRISATSVSHNDDMGNTWTITTEGTESFTLNDAYSQVGSSKSPATSITFTTTLPNEVELTSFTAKFGGFSGTAGVISMDVDGTEVGSGNLNATTDVTVVASSIAKGKVLTISITDIAKGVKCYNISYSFKFEGEETPDEPEDPVVIVPVEGLGQLKAANRGSDLYVSLENAVVTYVNGKNAFVEDATTGALIYMSGHGLNIGDCLNGTYQVTTEDFQGKFEITSLTAVEGETTTAEVPCTEVGIAELNANFDRYESMRLKINGVDVTTGIAKDSRSGEMTDGNNTIVLYAGMNGVVAEAGSNITVTGYPTYFNSTLEFAVWNQSDITVNSAPEEGDDEGDDDEEGDDEDTAESFIWTAGVLGDATLTALPNDGVIELNEIVTSVWNKNDGTTPAYNKDKTARLYRYNSLTLSAAEGYILTGVELTFNGSYVGSDMAADVAKYKTAESVGTWTGLSPQVTITNTGKENVQARILSIKVTYAQMTEASTVTVTDAGYATYSCNQAVVVGNGTKTSIVDGIQADGSTLNLKPVAVVPANEGVIIEGEGTYTLYTYEGLEASVSGNSLVASTTAPVGSYVLQNQNGVTGFYQVADADREIGDGHAYLTVPASVKAFLLQGKATAIQQIEVADTQSVFDLGGRRVNATQKGIYIVNGKKVVK